MTETDPDHSGGQTVNQVPPPTAFGEDEEDNNPFIHSGPGLSSLVSRQATMDASSQIHEDSGSILDDDSILLYNSNSKASNDTKNAANGSTSAVLNGITGKEAFNTVHMNFESRVTKLLKPGSKVRIQITEAGNSSEGMANASKKYVVYTIKLIDTDNSSDEILTRRRYSDFESLRDVLTKIFPLVIIPPIPPKNYLNLTILNGLVGQSSQQSSNSSENSSSIAYSYINSNHQFNKNKLIEHRKRLLGNFLNNCLKIPQIRNLEFFAKFLDPNANWSDEITLITSQLPKSVYLSNPENGLKTDSIYTNLPNPSNSHTMSFFKDNRKKITKKTNKLLSNGGITSAEPGVSGADQHPPGSSSNNGTASEKNGNTKYIINTSSLDEINKKIMDNYLGLSHDYVELGTVFNSFSLILSESTREGKSKAVLEDETKVNIIFDKIGQAFDRSYVTINALIGDLETKFSEPLGEAVQYSAILQSIAKFQNRKIRQQQLLDSELKVKRKDLEELLKTEEESNRIEGAINSKAGIKHTKYDLEEATSKRNQAAQTPRSAASSKFNLFPSMNSLKKITQYVTEIIDQNPEQTRKQKIVNLQAKIKTFEKCQEIMLEDISFIADEVNKNFQTFHAKQLKMIFDILLCYNRFLIGWAKKNIDIWEDIRDEVEKL
ncbi:uncharacterized protein RJT20DRAFT_129679 [Scheffersomyces xylosifermentans]|uniref:uncharacterized protein n=1 Tax=Scheffersomyces xylosifermentans TaxID=1304137 RepID=UPI00315C70EF